MQRRMRRWWAVPVLAGLGLVVMVILASASTAAPGEVTYLRQKLSGAVPVAAYPDIGAGTGGLVAAVWTEGTGPDGTKHNGPLKLGWVAGGSGSWTVVTVDGSTADGDKVYDAAVAVSGSQVHIAWSREAGSQKTIRYTSCTPPNCGPFFPESIHTGPDALEIDIALDNNGTPHVVWIEEGGDKKGKLYHSRKAASWTTPKLVAGSSDSEGPAIAYGRGTGGENFMHIVWTEWQDVNNTWSFIRYHRWDINQTRWSWSDASKTIASGWSIDNPARNPSVAADTGGNVYVAWDQLHIAVTRPYAIGYRHSNNNGEIWQTMRTYRGGNADGLGAVQFVSGKPESGAEEYVQFLRPQLTLVASGTLPVPVLSWHRRLDPPIAPGLAQKTAAAHYEVLWTYATQPGSKVTGDLYWAPYSMTLSTDFWGNVTTSVDQAAVRLAPTGKIGEILDTANPNGQLNAVFHERSVGTDDWWVAYHANKYPTDRFDVFMPVIFKKANLSGEG